MKENFYHWQGKDLIIKVQIQVRASKNAVIGLYGGSLKIAITAAPVDGKANKYLKKFLATYFKVAQSKVAILQGESSKHKSILISNPRENLEYFLN